MLLLASSLLFYGIMTEQEKVNLLKSITQDFLQTLQRIKRDFSNEITLLSRHIDDLEIDRIKATLKKA